MNRKGQALIEAVFVIPLLLLLVFGITEFGRALYIWNSLNNAARAGARVGAVTSTLAPAGATPLDRRCSYSTDGNDPVYAAVCSSLTVGFPDKTQVQVTIDVPRSPPVAGDSVTVTATLTSFQSVVPKMIAITPTLTATTVMRHE